MSEPLKVLITGAAGQIAYSLMFAVGKGDVFGPNQPLELVLLDIQPMKGVLDGVVMEMMDCSLPLVKNIIATVDETEGFKDVDVAMLVGAMPRREGMERKDLLAANVKIFKSQGQTMDKVSKKNIKVVVVGNPANTNALICSKFAPSIPKENFSCLTRLDQNRAQAQIAGKLGLPNQNVNNCIIWGNHSSTQFPDVSHATVVDKEGKKASVYEAVKNDDWLKGEFIKTVQTRGAAVIKARKLSSAMSAAKATCDHIRDWWIGSGDRYVSMGVISDGSYGIPEGLMYSFPVKTKADHTWEIVQGLSISDFAREKMDATAKELQEELKTALEVCEH